MLGARINLSGHRSDLINRIRSCNDFRLSDLEFLKEMMEPQPDATNGNHASGGGPSDS